MAKGLCSVRLGLAKYRAFATALNGMTKNHNSQKFVPSRPSDVDVRALSPCCKGLRDVSSLGILVSLLEEYLLLIARA